MSCTMNEHLCAVAAYNGSGSGGAGEAGPGRGPSAHQGAGGAARRPRVRAQPAAPRPDASGPPGPEVRPEAGCADPV